LSNCILDILVKNSKQAAASCSSRKMSLFSRSQHKSRSIRFEANLGPNGQISKISMAPGLFCQSSGIACQNIM
jgi:hypothetical protein